MKVREIMTVDPACCTPETSLREAAKMMVDNDCGCLPVVEDEKSMKPVGTITDRDICCRTVAEGKNPLEMKAGDCMSSPVVTISEDADVGDCCRVMEEKQVRRVPVVDERGSCCGIVAQADIAHHASDRRTGDVVREVSQATGNDSNV
jgi:CBS domain-containing protein